MVIARSVELPPDFSFLKVKRLDSFILIGLAPSTIRPLHTPMDPQGSVEEDNFLTFYVSIVAFLFSTKREVISHQIKTYHPAFQLSQVCCLDMGAASPSRGLYFGTSPSRLLVFDFKLPVHRCEHTNVIAVSIVTAARGWLRGSSATRRNSAWSSVLSRMGTDTMSSTGLQLPISEQMPMFRGAR